MSQYSPLIVLAVAAWLASVVTAYQKGRKTVALLSIPLAIAALLWGGMLILGVGSGYRDEPLSALGLTGFVALGAIPLLLAMAVPAVAALRPPLPGSRVALARAPAASTPAPPD